MPKLVLDLSNNNAEPTWHVLKDWRKTVNGRTYTVEGVLLKASEGATFTDPVFQNWSKRARAAGLRVGGYHFAQPGGGDALAEARWFASRLGKIQRRDFRPALDLEANPGNLSWSGLVNWSRQFNQEVQRLTGTLPIFYASAFWLRQMDANTPVGAALWLAHWSNDGMPFNPPIPSPWKKAPLHQFTSEATGRSPLHPLGVPGRVDINQINNFRPLLAHPVTGLV